MNAPKKLKTSQKHDHKKLVDNVEQFQIALTNKFSILNSQLDPDINHLNEEIVKTFKQTCIEIAGKAKKNNNIDLPTEIKDLMKKRRTWKRNNAINRIEYAELCKTIRFEIRQNTRNKNMEQIEKAINDNGSIKKVKKENVIRKQLEIISF